MSDCPSRKDQILDAIAKKIQASLPASGEMPTSINNLYLSRKDLPHPPFQCLSRPMAGLIAQGKKLIELKSNAFLCSRGDILVTCIETPHSTSLNGISPGHPFLSVFFSLDKTILTDLAGQTPIAPGNDHHAIQPLNVRPAPADFLETLLRLLELCDKPEHIPALAPLLLKELHYLLLAGPQGRMLRELYIKGSRDNRILEAIAWLKANANSTVSIDELARKVNMSVSSLHRHFKEVTGFSPLQYHKQLRLYEAQRLMLSENERADRAAMAVGYESITQFNREYKRMFGLPPHKDIIKRKSSL